MFKELREVISNIVGIPEEYLEIKEEDIPFAVEVVNLIEREVEWK